MQFKCGLVGKVWSVLPDSNNTNSEPLVCEMVCMEQKYTSFMGKGHAI